MKHVPALRSAFGTIALLVSLAPGAGAGPLTVVNVNSPAYQFVFSPTGTVVVQDTVDTFAVSGAAGLARLQSRTAQGLPGSPAAGLYRYSYRLILTDAYGILDIPCITSLKIRFGAVVSSLDYNGDAIAGDQVFVVTSGGLGSVGLASAVQSGSDITFTFQGGVCAGGSPGTGESSFFFGLVSARAPRFVTATVTDFTATTYTPQARAPKLLLIVFDDDWVAMLESILTPADGRRFLMHIDMVRGPRFGGTMQVSVPGAPQRSLSFQVHGVLLSEGELQITGWGQAGRLSAKGSILSDAPLIQGRYRLDLADGTSDEGSLTLTQDPRLLPDVSMER
jgi:hypothetical protein